MTDCQFFHGISDSLQNGYEVLMMLKSILPVCKFLNILWQRVPLKYIKKPLEIIMMAKVELIMFETSLQKEKVLEMGCYAWHVTFSI